MSMPTVHLAEQYFQPKIDLIQHLIQYSQNILLITAPPEGGKTAFAKFCLAHPTPQLKKHLLVVTASLSVETMMENIAKGFGMSWPQNGPLASEAVQKIWTLFVEDAHLLNVDMLEALVRLVNFHQEPRRQLHLILLGEDKLVEQFSAHRITNLVGSYSTVIELALPSNWRQNAPAPFAEPTEFTPQKQVTNAVEFGRSQLPEFDDLLAHEAKVDPLTDTDIDLLDELSDNWPQSETQPISAGRAQSNKSKPIFSHPVAYGLYLGAMMGVGLWMWQSKEVPQFIPEGSADMVALAPVAPPSLPEATFEPQSEFLSMAEPQVAEARVPEPQIEREFKPEVVPVKLAAKPKPTKLAAEPMQKRVPPKVVVSKVASKAEKLEKIEKADRKPKTAEKTILAKNKTHYTVQLYGSNESQKVVNFKQAHGLDKAWVVEKKRHGQTWHVLVMGDYATKTQAQQATERLPNSLHQAKVKPWVRDFASLQNEIVNSGKKG